jgi:hypothetical protein
MRRLSRVGAGEIAGELLFLAVTFPTAFLQSFCAVETTSSWKRSCANAALHLMPLARPWIE